MWREYLPQRVIPSGDTPVIVNKGDIAIVAKVETWDQAAKVLELLEELRSRVPV